MLVKTVLRKNPECYVCGENKAQGLRLRFEHSGPFASQAVVRARPELEGWKGMMHGGVAFTLMDEALGWCLYFEGVRAVTAKIETRFLKPIATETDLRVRAWVVADRRRLLEACAQVTSADDDQLVYATASATMMRRNGEE